MNYADFQFLKFETRPSGVLLITLNRPEVMNATNARLHWELTQIWGVVNDDPATRVVVVTGAGDRAVSAGGDLNWIAETVGNSEKVAATMKEAGDIVFNMLACDKPIISAINGVAVGAGAVIACACDFRIASAGAKFGFIFPKVGLCGADMGATYLLPLYLAQVQGYSAQQIGQTIMWSGRLGWQTWLVR